MRDELLLLVFLHGFKGGADTFDAFPERVTHILSQAQPRVDVQPVVYPPYDTRGELVQAVDNHISWLTTLVAERKDAFTKAGGKGPTSVVLLGHSMGGLVIADTVLNTLSSDSLPILGVIAYDSPFLGLHPAVFKNTFDKAIGYASQGQAVLAALGVGYGLFSGSKSGSTTPPSAPMSSTSASTARSKDTTVANSDKTAAKSSPWLSLSTVASLAAAAGAVGAAGAAYYNRDAISSHVGWATSHLSFLGELWKTTELERRIEELVQASENGVGFHCFYTSLPPSAAAASRTFCLLPASTSTLRPCFTANTNTRAADEITAHIEMFTDKSDGMYELGQKTCSLLGEWIEDARRGEMGQRKAKELGKGKEKEGERLV